MSFAPAISRAADMGLEALTESVVIQSPTIGTSTVGQRTLDWSSPTVVATVPAAVIIDKGMEAIRANADDHLNLAVVRIEHRSDVTTDMRFVHGTDVYSIRAAGRNIPHTRLLEFVAERVS